MAMKRTLLELTQDILASMDGDDVSTITDTAESSQVSNIIRQCFYEIAANHKLPEHHKFFELTETSSSTPTIMTRPTDVISIDWIKYDNIDTGETDKNYQEVRYLRPDDMTRMLDGLNTDETSIAEFNYTIGSDIFPIKYTNDKQPQYYTSFDDSTILFDSLDTGIETFLRKTKTWCYGLKESSWTHSGSAVPDLDHKLSNLLFQRAKAQCFLELKQAAQPSAEKKARRAELILQKEKFDINSMNRGYYNNPNQLPNYGRK